MQNNYIYTKTKVMTIETKVMDTFFDIVILTRLVQFRTNFNLNKIEFTSNSLLTL